MGTSPCDVSRRCDYGWEDTAEIQKNLINERGRTQCSRSQ